ncbi:hypothetical protein ACFU9C_47390, partial [Streptomyces sp. NPDC057580]
MPSPFASVRARATLASTVVVSIALVAAGVLVVAVLRHNLTDRASLQAEVTARTVAGAQAALDGNFGSLDLPDDEDQPVQVVDAAGKVIKSSTGLAAHTPISLFARTPKGAVTLLGARTSDGVSGCGGAGSGAVFRPWWA